MANSSYLERLKTLKEEGDYPSEGCHVKADAILVEALEALAGTEGKAIAEAYEDLRDVADFWYA